MISGDPSFRERHQDLRGAGNGLSVRTTVQAAPVDDTCSGIAGCTALSGSFLYKVWDFHPNRSSIFLKALSCPHF